MVLPSTMVNGQLPALTVLIKAPVVALICTSTFGVFTAAVDVPASIQKVAVPVLLSKAKAISLTNCTTVGKGIVRITVPGAVAGTVAVELLLKPPYFGNHSKLLPQPPINTIDSSSTRVFFIEITNTPLNNTDISAKSALPPA